MTTVTFISIQPNTNSTTSFLANDPYIDTFWLPLLGPTATLLLNSLMSRALYEHDQFDIELNKLSMSIGVGNREGSASPIAKNLKRLSDFGLLSKHNEKYYVPTSIDTIEENHLRKLNSALQLEHKKWLVHLNADPVSTQRQKARFVYSSLMLKSASTIKIRTALSRSGLHPSIIGETINHLSEFQLN